MLVARGTVVVVCVIAVVVFALRRADAATCDSSKRALFAAAVQHTAPADLVGDVVDTCRDPEEIAVAAAGVSASGHPDVAAAMAREAIAAGPRDFVAWAALSQALAGDDPAGAARAARRAKALNPRWRPATRSPAPTAAPPGAAGSAGP
jgi:hypothetical protein